MGTALTKASARNDAKRMLAIYERINARREINRLHQFEGAPE